MFYIEVLDARNLKSLSLDGRQGQFYLIHF